MDYESIKADVLKELESLGLPQSEIDRIILDFDNIVTKVSDDPSLMKRLATDLISAAKFRANLKSEVPNTIPEEVKSLQTDSKSTDSLGKQLSAKTAVFNEGEYAGRSIEDVWQNTVKNKRTPGTAGKSGKPDGSGLIQPGNMQDSYDAYDDLWKQWFSQNPDIYQQAVAKRKEGYTFVDTFGKAGNVRQDETIMRIIDSDWIPSQQNTLKYTDDFFDPKLNKITSLPDNHIFVFGSNTAGRHGKGAALDARNNFGAIPGQGYGLQGQSFGIPTKDGQLNVLDNAQIQKYVNNFLEFAKNNPDKTFVFTDIGTGLAGKNANEISSMLTNVPNNVILSKKFSGGQGGSLGAAKLNDPNVFETFLENATADEKKMVKGLDESGKLDDVGGVKGLVIDLVTQYPQTAKVIGRSLGVFLQGAATIIDPIGEAIDLGLKLGGKKPVVGGKNAIKREAYTWALWQASAFGWTQIQDMGNIVNMTLNKVGLLPDWFTDKVDVPQNMEEVNAEYTINTEKNRRLGNQGYKATSLWWWLDQGIPARLTGLSPIEWGIRKWQYNQFGDITDDEKKFLDIMYGYDTRMEKNKESMFGWWQNEFDTNFNKKYYNEAHINDFRKIEKIKPEYGSEGVELYNDFKELGLIDE
jgi:hypothetical protein